MYAKPFLFIKVCVKKMKEKKTCIFLPYSIELVRAASVRCHRTKSTGIFFKCVDPPLPDICAKNFLYFLWGA